MTPFGGGDTAIAFLSRFLLLLWKEQSEAVCRKSFYEYLLQLGFFILFNFIWGSFASFCLKLFFITKKKLLILLFEYKEFYLLYRLIRMLFFLFRSTFFFRSIFFFGRLFFGNFFFGKLFLEGSLFLLFAFIFIYFMFFLITFFFYSIFIFLELVNFFVSGYDKMLRVNRAPMILKYTYFILSPSCSGLTSFLLPNKRFIEFFFFLTNLNLLLFCSLQTKLWLLIFRNIAFVPRSHHAFLILA